MKTVIESVSPGMAKAYLALSRGNRNLRKIWVTQLARDMKAGRFLLSHESIAFLQDGSLFDGHHRLEAVVESGKTVEMRVTRGVSESCIHVVDRGRGRTTTDAYQISGEKWFNRQFAAVGRMWMTLLGKRYPTDAELFEFCSLNRLYIEEVLQIHTCNTRTIYSHTAVVAMLAIGIKMGKQDLLEGWFKCFSTGIASQEYQSSAVSLREWWLRSGNRNGGTDVRIELCHRIYGSMRAWCERRPLSKSYKAATIDWLEPAQ